MLLRARQSAALPVGGRVRARCERVDRAADGSRLDGRVRDHRARGPGGRAARLEVRSGRGATVVTEVAREHNAGLIVLGGKHHSTLGRWMGGSTAHHVVRVTDIPTLVTGEKVGDMRRILIAADLSDAVRLTFEAAARMARLLGAELRALHVVEPLPAFAEMPALWNEEAFYQDSQAQFERCLEPLLKEVVAESVVRRGYAAEAIAAEVAAWGADLVVVGSHGKGRS